MTDPAGVDRGGLWLRLLGQAGKRPPTLQSTNVAELPAGKEREALLALYRPLADDPARPLVVAHIGQSLDGRIAAVNGRSQWVTGPADVVHNHRMRALFDAVLVGAGTVRNDDPSLTVREVAGEHPVRVVIDARRRLGDGYRVFRDGEAPSLLLCAPRHGPSGTRHGLAEVIEIGGDGLGLEPRAILDALAARGLRRVFIEGGGVTISRFLEAGCLDRLQITVAPVILGSGRPGIMLPEIQTLEAACRPRVRRFDLGADTLFECVFHD